MSGITSKVEIPQSELDDAAAQVLKMSRLGNYEGSGQLGKLLLLYQLMALCCKFLISLIMIFFCFQYKKGHDFIANVSVWLQLNDRGHLQSSPLNQLCSQENINGTLSEKFQHCCCYMFLKSLISKNLHPLQVDFNLGKSQKVNGSKIAD